MTTLTSHEQRLLDGDSLAARAVMLDSRTLINALSTPFQGVEVRDIADGTGGSKIGYRGYASIVDTPYEMEDFLGAYTETIEAAAFNKTLSENPDVAFLLNHAGATMARTKPGTLQLHADSTGLLSEARMDPSRSDVQIVRAGVESGDLDEMSFAFRVVRQEWNADYTERTIREVNLNKGDVSVVNYGANPFTAGSVELLSRSRPVLTRLMDLMAPADERRNDEPENVLAEIDSDAVAKRLRIQSYLSL